MVGGLHRALARPIVKKTPFNTKMLAAMMNDTHKNGSPSNVHLSSVYLLGVLAFASFLRFDELSKLCLTDLTLEKDKLRNNQDMELQGRPIKKR